MLLLSKKLLNENFEEPALPKTKEILKKILAISLPAALEIFFIGLIGLFDTIMVGGIGDHAIAAVSIAQQPVFITLAACTGLNAGAIAIISRRRGQNDREGANKNLRHIITLGMIISLFTTVIAVLFGKQFMIVAGAKPDTINEATIYFQIVSSVLFFNYLRLIITSSLRAIGKTNLTLVTNVVANLVNIVLNYCLIEGRFGFPRLEVKGAAIATAIGNIVAFIIAFIAIYKSKGFLSIRFRDDWKLNKDTTKNILGVSSNAFVEQLFMRIGFFLIALIVNNLGTAAVAVNAIVSSVISLSFNIVDGFSIGASSLVGRSLGENRKNLAFAYGKMTQILGIIIGCIMFAIAIIFRNQLADIFSKNETTVAAAGKLMLFAAFVMIPQSVQWVTTGILRGAGDTKYTARSSLISVTIIRPIFSFTLCYILGFGLYGSWAGMFIDQSLRFYLNNRRFLSLKWIQINL